MNYSNRAIKIPENEGLVNPLCFILHSTLIEYASMIKNFLMKKMLQKQLKDLPKEQQEAFSKAIEKNPKLFEKIAKEMQAEMKAGKNQMTAAMNVLPKYQKELQELMGDDLPQGGGAQFTPDGKIKR